MERITITYLTKINNRYQSFCFRKDALSNVDLILITGKGKRSKRGVGNGDKSRFPIPHSPFASPPATSKSRLVGAMAVYSSVHRFIGFEVQSVEQRFFDLINFGPPFDLHVNAVAVGGRNFENLRFTALVGQTDFDGGFGELRRDRARRLVEHFGGLSLERGEYLERRGLFVLLVRRLGDFPFIVFLFGHERDVGILDVVLR